MIKKFSAFLLLLLFSSLLYAVSPITPVILVDNSECLFKIVAFEESSRSFTLKSQCENRSSDKTYTFSISNSTVNGLMKYSSGYAEVAPKKKANMNITFYGLKDDNIDLVSDINLYYRVYDSNDWLSDPVGKGNEHVYPYGKDKAKKYNRIKGQNDVNLISTPDVTVVLIDKNMDSGLELSVYLENNTDNNVMFSSDDSSINGYMIDPYWATSVLPNSSSYSKIRWSKQNLEDNLIFDIEEIEFELSVSDYDDWFAPDIATKTINLSF